MADPTPNRPLWKVMQDAANEVSKTSGPIHSRRGYAAELRAIAEWLEAMWAAQAPTPDIPIAFAEGLAMGMKMHREGTLNILRDEADRAEVGE
jgi:hypothetical protein